MHLSLVLFQHGVGLVFKSPSVTELLQFYWCNVSYVTLTSPAHLCVIIRTHLTHRVMMYAVGGENMTRDLLM